MKRYILIGSPAAAGKRVRAERVKRTTRLFLRQAHPQASECFDSLARTITLPPEKRNVDAIWSRGLRPTNQPTNQPTNRPTDRPNDRPTNHPLVPQGAIFARKFIYLPRDRLPRHVCMRERVCQLYVGPCPVFCVFS